MELHVLVIVLVITLNVVLARPKETVSRKIRATDDIKPSGFWSPTMRLPIPLQEGWIMNITGRLNLAHPSLEIVFPSKSGKKDYWKFTYDYKDETYNIHVYNETTEEQPYSLTSETENPSDNPPFRLDIEGGKDEFIVILNVNDAGEIITTIENVTEIEDFDRIEFGKGLESITSLLMKVKD